MMLRSITSLEEVEVLSDITSHKMLQERDASYIVRINKILLQLVINLTSAFKLLKKKETLLIKPDVSIP